MTSFPYVAAEPVVHLFGVATAWGQAVLHAHGDLIVALRPPDGTAGPGAPADATSRGAPTAVREVAERLAAYLDGEEVELAEPEALAAWLHAAGVRGFRHELSLALFDVPRGVTLAYGELAGLAGRPGAARAAGTACARNPLPIVVPCHRVVHAGARRGDVGSYGAASGSQYKRRLLELEGARLVTAIRRGIQ